MSRLAILAVVAMSCGGGQVVHDEPAIASMQKFLPATLEARRPKQIKAGDAVSLHVRIWTDATVRANPHWKDAISDQLDYATQFLTPLVGAKLVIDDWKEWDRSPTAPAATALDDLAKLDPGEHEAWVLGYVGPNEAATKVLADLADARPLGKHVVLHTWATGPETARLMTGVPKLSPADRGELVAAHERHQMTVALLHGLAITLAAIDETDPTWLQNPAYSPKQTTFSDRNRETLELAITLRLERAEPEVAAAKLLDAIEKTEYGGWIDRSKAEVVAALKTAIEQGKAGATAADIPAVAYDEWERINTIRKQSPKDPAQALEELDHLLAAYPANATMHQLKCDMLLVKPGVASPVTRAACARVSELAPGDPRPHLAVGEAIAATAGATAGAVDGKARVAAHDELVKAEPKIGNLANADEIGATWHRLVGDYARMSFTWTEDALAKAAAANVAIGAWGEAHEVVQGRARYGVPRGTKIVAPENELLLKAAVQTALSLVYANKYGEAERALGKAEKAWPHAPGLSAVRCDLAMRQNQIDAARAHCARAIAAQPDESWALYLSGVIDLKDTSASGTTRGVEQLKKAIAADPDLGQAWRTLGKALARAHDQAGLDELGKAYQTKFGQPLPGA